MADATSWSRRRETVLIGGAVVPFALIGLLVGLLSGAAIVGALSGAVVGTVLVTVLRARADRIVLAVSGARPLGSDEQPRLRNLVDGLGLANGVPSVDLYLIDDPASNALVTADARRTASIAVTTGLVDALERVELEAVVGQLLSRIKSGEARSSTIAAVIAGAVPLVGDLAARSTPSNGDRTDPDRTGRGGFVGYLAYPVRALAPVFGALLRRAVPEGVVTTADIAGCRMTRYPPGLVSALEKVGLEGGVTHVATTATAHLWFEQPMSGVGDSSRTGGHHRRFVVHPPLDERIALLREL